MSGDTVAHMGAGAVQYPATTAVRTGAVPAWYPRRLGGTAKSPVSNVDRQRDGLHPK
jgi:hypothetical protein